KGSSACFPYLPFLTPFQIAGQSLAVAAVWGLSLSACAGDPKPADAPKPNHWYSFADLLEDPAAYPAQGELLSGPMLHFGADRLAVVDAKTGEARSFLAAGSRETKALPNVRSTPGFCFNQYDAARVANRLWQPEAAARPGTHWSRALGAAV